MNKEMANSSQPPPGKRTQAAAASQEVNGGPTKRLRRPSVLLNQSYYETFSSRRRLTPPTWNGATKSRTPKPGNVENSKQSKNCLSNNGEGFKGFNVDGDDDDDDDVAIGAWKKLHAGDTGNSNLKLKSNKSFSTSGSNEDRNNERESWEPRERGQEMDFGANGMDMNLLEARKLDLRRSLFGTDNRSIDDDDDQNVVGRDTNGVREWLNQLGLGKYALLFEVHEVDDEVLPLLTIDDLKDMGISAIGSRRKMYHSIKKLGRGFS